MAGLRPYDDTPRERVHARGKIGKRLGYVGWATCGLMVLAYAGGSALGAVAAFVLGLVAVVVVFALDEGQLSVMAPPNMTMPERGFEMGQTANAELRLPGISLDGASCIARLVCREEVLFAHGDRPRHVHPVVNRPCPTVVRAIDAGIAFDIEIAIPDQGPQSLNLTYNKVIWELDAEVRWGEARSWHRTYPFRVQPVQRRIAP